MAAAGPTENIMSRIELDYLLEKAVAEALGVRMVRPRKITPRPRHVARTPKRAPAPAIRELRVA
jgi:hypothetical protein